MAEPDKNSEVDTDCKKIGPSTSAEEHDNEFSKSVTESNSQRCDSDRITDSAHSPENEAEKSTTDDEQSTDFGASSTESEFDVSFTDTDPSYTETKDDSSGTKYPFMNNSEKLFR